MDFNDKLNLITSAIKVADFWGVEVKDLLALQAMLKPKEMEKWNKIAVEVQEFSKMNIVDRGKKLGLDIVMEEPPVK